MRSLVGTLIWLQSRLRLLSARQQPVLGSNPTRGVSGEVRVFGLRIIGCALILEMVASDCPRHVGNEFVIIEADGLGVGVSGPQKSVLGAQQERRVDSLRVDPIEGVPMCAVAASVRSSALGINGERTARRGTWKIVTFSFCSLNRGSN